jgi:hypothetical protein
MCGRAGCVLQVAVGCVCGCGRSALVFAGFPTAFRLHEEVARTLLRAPTGQVAVNNAYDGSAYPANVQDFLNKQRAWVDHAATFSQTDPYWYQGMCSGGVCIRCAVQCV